MLPSLALNGLYLVSYTIPIWVLVGLALGGPFWLLAPLNIALIHPVVDTLFQRSRLGRALAEAKLRVAGASRLAEAVLVAYPFIQGALLVLLLRDTRGRSPLELLAMALSFGAMAGALGLSAAHELIHRRHRAARALGIGLLMTSSYPHFTIEHLVSHHRLVATPADTDTARVGESLYAFLVRSTISGFVASARLRPRQFAALWAGQLAAYAVIAWAFGGAGLAFFAAASAVAVLVIETANYVEHYGLTRREIAPGRYEKVTPRHSWDSHHLLTNVSLFNLGLHSDHHSRPIASFPALGTRDEANVLPFGFSVMLLLAWVPPLWFRVMNPRCARTT